ncbi:WXG100 family type VII secretion target [Streptomyces sp. NPDC016566]|uniref:WXG100 family type VII secretion target n=1 Tax=Streptomyces sp. NPDC016566 TaxID=3364967 RepID=UPI0036FC76B3
MADIQLQHETVQQATEEMKQATKTMITNLEDLIQGLQNMRSTFSGQSAQEFNAFLKVAHQAEGVMHNDFGQGSNALEGMHECLTNADNKGATLFQ